MARLKKEEIFEGYVRVREPDYKELARLTDQAKGEGRSLSEFARECGVSKATMSRILNCNCTSPVTDSIIAQIAVHRSPESGVTITALLDAHGLAPVEAVSKAPEEVLARISARKAAEGGACKASGKHASTTVKAPGAKEDSAVETSAKSSADGLPGSMDTADAGTSGPYTREASTYAAQNERIKRFRNAVLSALLERGCSVTLDGDMTAIRGIEFDMLADFVLKTDALKAEGTTRWAFAMLNEKNFSAVYALDHYFGMMYLNHPSEMSTRVTLITEDLRTIRVLKDAYDGCRIPDSFSVMLIDGNGLVCEFVFDRSGGTDAVRLFEDVPLPEQED